MSDRPTWLILGASSSIGRAFARAAAGRGCDVILAGRDNEDLERTASDIRVVAQVNAEVVDFDALSTEKHESFASTVAASTGQLNVALLFGFMPEQEEMDSNPAETLACIAASFGGAVSVLHWLAPYLERNGRGMVIAFGSVAGDRGRLKNYVYGSAKAGLHTYLAGLRNRLGRKGVHVMTVKPGFIDTPMTWGKSGVFLAADPKHVAHACFVAAEKHKNVLYVPWFWRWIMLVICSIPERIFKKLSI